MWNGWSIYKIWDIVCCYRYIPTLFATTCYEERNWFHDIHQASKLFFFIIQFGWLMNLIIYNNQYSGWFVCRMCFIGTLWTHSHFPWRFLRIQSYGMALILPLRDTLSKTLQRSSSNVGFIMIYINIYKWLRNHISELFLYVNILNSYAGRRGIHVLAEIDVPGHALSW